MLLLSIYFQIDAGADFIITQAVFSAEKFEHFISRCRKANITVPILPGLWLFDTYQRLNSCANFCKVKVDSDIWEAVENLKFDPVSLKKYGIDLISNLMNTLLKNNEVPGVHWFSLNDLELVEEIRKVL